MNLKKSQGEVLFNALNITLLTLFSLTCLFPYIHILAVSLSSSTAASAGEVYFWPVEFTTKSYDFILGKSQFVVAFIVSMKRVVLGTIIALIITILTAYPLSKDNSRFKSRSFYVWFFVITMFISGGLIPWYLVVRAAGLIDSLWSLVLPSAVQVFNITILLNFFRGLPKELEESAFLDGAGHITYLTRIVLQLSVPCLMTLTLFTIVFHWNSWFDGLIFMNLPQNYPLQTFIQTTILSQSFQFTNITDLEVLKSISLRTVRAAEVLVTSIPVLAAYPFIQKYFMSGITLGSVKE